jgi:hypothetical protein
MQAFGIPGSNLHDSEAFDHDTDPMKIPPAIRIYCLLAHSPTAHKRGGESSGTVLGTTMWQCGDYTSHSENIYRKSRGIIDYKLAAYGLLSCNAVSFGTA